MFFCLFAFPLAFAMRLVRFCLAALVDWAFHIFGQLQNINDIDKLLLGNGIVVNAECRKADPCLFLGVAALKVHGIPQLALNFLCNGWRVCRCGIGAVFLPNVTEDSFQIVGKYMTEIIILPHLGQLQCPGGKIVLPVLLYQGHLPYRFQHGVHIVDPHICDPIHINLRIQHHTLEILVAQHFRQ